MSISPIGLNFAEEAIAKYLGLDLDVASSFFGSHGVSRLTDQTGLDVITVPVWGCIRPSSRSVAVCFGKGMTDAEAQISALMESLECACAEERGRLSAFHGSLASCKANGLNIVNLEALHQCRFEILDENFPLDWVKGQSLISRTDVFAPFDIVGLDYMTPTDQASLAFHMSSVGIGAGRTLEQATTHALLEIIENDAASYLEIFPRLRRGLPYGQCPPGINLKLDLALSWFQQTGISPVFRLVSQEFGLSVVMCEIPRFGEQLASSADVSVGIACRGNVIDAALSALLEAAQTRVTLIAGAREDLQFHHYRVSNIAGETATKPQLASFFCFDSGGLAAKPSLDILLESLQSKGMNGVHAFTLSEENSPICVVRALIEGLDSTAGEARSTLNSRDIAAILRMGRGLT